MTFDEHLHDRKTTRTSQNPMSIGSNKNTPKTKRPPRNIKNTKNNQDQWRMVGNHHRSAKKNKNRGQTLRSTKFGCESNMFLQARFTMKTATSGRNKARRWEQPTMVATKNYQDWPTNENNQQLQSAENNNQQQLPSTTATTPTATNNNHQQHTNLDLKVAQATKHREQQ